jgi:hypothetical protein
MLALVVVEIVPDGVSEGGWLRTAAGAVPGAALMLVLSSLLGIE